jgi:hypothetical protein
MRSLQAELNQRDIASLDPHLRIAELENENAILRRLLDREVISVAARQLAAVIRS